MGDEQKVRLLEASLEGRRKRRRLTAITAASAVVFAVIAATAIYYWYQAQRALTDATTTIAALVEAMSEAAQANPHGDNVEALLEMARKSIDSFASSSNDPLIIEQRARSYLILAEIDFERGSIDRMQEDARLALTNLDRLVSRDNLEARHLRARTERLLGASDWERGNNDAAKLHLERGIEDLNDLLKRNVDVNVAWRWMRSLADLYQALGDVLLFRFDARDEALAAFNKSRELRERLVGLGHQGPALEHDLAWVISKRAEVAERKGNIDEALNLSAEALGRMENLKDRIWDNLHWAADFATINANIGRLKRKQKRYAEAAPIFARAEDILVTVNLRDPKNITRSSTLNWVRYLRAENMFRLGVQNNDRVRLLSAREEAQKIIATSAALASGSPERAAVRMNKVREEAFLAAIDATLRQLNGNFDSAAAGFLEASDTIAKGYLSDAKSMPWGDLIAENIEYLEWAGAAYVKAQKPAEAQAQFRRAAEMLGNYRAVVGEKVYEDLHQRIEARLGGAPAATGTVPPASANRIPPADRGPAASDRTPTTTESIPDRSPPATGQASPAPQSAPPTAQAPTVQMPDAPSPLPQMRTIDPSAGPPPTSNGASPDSTPSAGERGPAASDPPVNPPQQ